MYDPPLAASENNRSAATDSIDVNARVSSCKGRVRHIWGLAHRSGSACRTQCALTAGMPYGSTQAPALTDCWVFRTMENVPEMVCVPSRGGEVCCPVMTSQGFVS
jgi:hypothetical protein